MRRAVAMTALLSAVPAILCAQERTERMEQMQQQHQQQEHELQQRQQQLHQQQLQLQHVEERLHQHLFAPEMLMRYERELDLTDEQTQAMRALVRDLQHQLVDLQFNLQEANQALLDLVEAENVDADAAVAQFRRVLAIEQEVKTTHFRTLLSLKGMLTPEQRQFMEQTLHGGMMHGGPGMGMGPMMIHEGGMPMPVREMPGGEG